MGLKLKNSIDVCKQTPGVEVYENYLEEDKAIILLHWKSNISLKNNGPYSISLTNVIKYLKLS